MAVPIHNTTPMMPPVTPPKMRTGIQKEATITAAPASRRNITRVSRGTLRRSRPHHA